MCNPLVTALTMHFLIILKLTKLNKVKFQSEQKSPSFLLLLCNIVMLCKNKQDIKIDHSLRLASAQTILDFVYTLYTL
jgi:hypothetical protein